MIYLRTVIYDIYLNDINKAIEYYNEYIVYDDSEKYTLVKIGRYGTYLQQDEKSANLYDDYIPSELNFNNAVELLKKKKEEAKHSYIHPDTNQPIFLKEGRFGPYIQCEKKMKSLPPDMTLIEVTEKIALDLLELPFKILASLIVVINFAGICCQTSNSFNVFAER